jgi:hypothetical protein
MITRDLKKGLMCVSQDGQEVPRNRAT